MIYKNKTGGISPKDFRNYQNMIELFKDFRDGNINAKEVLKDEINFKSDLGEIKKGNKKSKPEYYLELLTPGTKKLLGSIKSKITKDENGENMPYLEITEVVLIGSNIANNNYQQDSRVLHTFVPNKSLGNLLDTSPKSFIF